MLQCVVNLSEGRRAEVIAQIARAAGATLLDVHTDAWHNRSVLTLAGPGTEDAIRAVAAGAVELLHLPAHEGVHPRLGVVDVVPFVPLLPGAGPDELAAAPLGEAVRAREDFLRYAGEVLGIPAFRYGPERSLPEVRRGAFVDLAPDAGPASPHPSAGSCCVGARRVLVAYNLVLERPDLDLARRIARELRSPDVRALAFVAGRAIQVSCNLVAPWRFGPLEAFDAVAGRADVASAELVGLVPESVLERVPRERWAQLDLGEDRTVEARLARG
ncbi:MAG TPA: hypothetical protein VMU75_05890 [Acidimicrobiales bacterium]|nr:hypothetical protein [Acidimicrobiales bacterium]